MKKSDVFIAIVLLRSDKPRAEGEILEHLSFTLKHLSTNLDSWDEKIDPSKGTQIITKIGSTKGEVVPGPTHTRH